MVGRGEGVWIPGRKGGRGRGGTGTAPWISAGLISSAKRAAAPEGRAGIVPHAQYLKGTEDRKTSVFLPDLPWYLPVGADGRLAELQAEAFHGAVPVPPRLPPLFLVI